MLAAAILSLTIVPILMGYFVRGKIRSERSNPVSRAMLAVYHPVLRGLLRHRVWVLVATVPLLGVTAWPITRIGSEFMPPLYEGDLFYMPSMLPGISITKARQVLQQTDQILKSFPEVAYVFGKVGRAGTATDPAPLNMSEVDPGQAHSTIGES